MDFVVQKCWKCSFNMDQEKKTQDHVGQYTTQRVKRRSTAAIYRTWYEQNDADQSVCTEIASTLYG